MNDRASRPLDPPAVYGNPERAARSEALLAALADAPEPTAADGSSLVRCTYRRDGLTCANRCESGEHGYQVAGKPVCFSCSIRARTDARERAERAARRAWAGGSDASERVHAPTSGLARYARGWR